VDDGKGMMIMKVLKGISFFLIYPLLLLGVGFYTGVKASQFFYPGEHGVLRQESIGQAGYADNGQTSMGQVSNGQTSNGPSSVDQEGFVEQQSQPGTDGFFDFGETSEEASQEAAVMAATLCVDTKYVLEEADILNHTVVETTQRLPDKYIGMDREQFLQSMETYELSPPLSEHERGFVSLEVLAFSRERVVVRKNYKYVQPSSSFYLAAYDNEVVVYLEDKETVYIETQIRLDSLPEDLQKEIIEMMWIEDEEKLYSFLENYSS